MYTVKQVASKLNISEHTIRYYDRQGLMPFLNKDQKGRRIFKEEDIRLVELILCLKSSHMSLEDIKKYITYKTLDKDTCEIERIILESHKKFILKQIDELNKSLCSIDYKLNNCIYNNCE